MAGGDRTGPTGMGARTGRGAGFCAGYGAPGHMSPTGGRRGGFWGWGRGRGGGWGRRTGLGAGRFGAMPVAGGYPVYGPVGSVAPTREQELEHLKQQAAHLQGALADIQQRIEELQAEATST